MIEGGLIGKVVKTDNVHFIGFLEQRFPYADTTMLFIYSDKPGIIYTGRYSLNKKEKGIVDSLSNDGQNNVLLYSKKQLEDTGIDFISTYAPDGKFDIDLSDRRVLLDLIFSKWDLDYSQHLDMSILEVLLEMDLQDFYNFLKIRWYSRTSCVNIDNHGIYSSKAIYKLLNEPIERTYAAILSISTEAAVSGLELSIASFIRNAKAHNYRESDDEEDEGYDATLKNFDINSSDREKELTVTLSKYRNMTHNKKLKLIWLIQQLKTFIKETEKNDN